MGSICVSSAPILRCISLTQTENIALIIPVALEFATSSSFLFFNRGFGGWVFFLWPYFCFLLFRIQETLTVVGRGMGLFHSCNARASFGPSSYVSSQSITIPCLWYGHRYPSVYPIVWSQKQLIADFTRNCIFLTSHLVHFIPLPLRERGATQKPSPLCEDRCPGGFALFRTCSCCYKWNSVCCWTDDQWVYWNKPFQFRV